MTEGLERGVGSDAHRLHSDRQRAGSDPSCSGAWNVEDASTVDVRGAYERFLRDRHRPAHARRTADSVAAFFLPRLHVGDHIVDLGCGPASVTVGLGAAVGPAGSSSAWTSTLDRHRSRWCATTSIACRSLTAASTPFSCAPCSSTSSTAATTARGSTDRPDGRRHRSGRRRLGRCAQHPGGPVAAPRPRDHDRTSRGHQPVRGSRATWTIERRPLRGRTGDRAGSRWRGPDSSNEAAFQASFFDAPAVINMVQERDIASPGEMTAIAAAWRRWGNDPAATATRHWFEANAHAGTS